MSTWTFNYSYENKTCTLRTKTQANKDIFLSSFFVSAVVVAEIVVCRLACLSPLVFSSTRDVLSPELYVRCLDLFYFERIHDWVYGRVSVTEQDANVDSYFVYCTWPIKVINGVHNVERKPGQGKQKQDQRQRPRQQFLFLQVVLRRILGSLAWFLSKVSSDGAEDVAVQYSHHRQRYQVAEKEVEVNQVRQGHHFYKTAFNSRVGAILVPSKHGSETQGYCQQPTRCYHKARVSLRYCPFVPACRKQAMISLAKHVCIWVLWPCMNMFNKTTNFFLI